MTDETSDETSDLFLHKIVALTALVNVSIFYFAVFANLDLNETYKRLGPTAMATYDELKDAFLVGSVAIAISSFGIVTGEYSVPYLNVIYMIYSFILLSSLMTFEYATKGLSKRERESFPFVALRNCSILLLVLSTALSYHHHRQSQKDKKDKTDKIESEGIEV